MYPLLTLKIYSYLLFNDLINLDWGLSGRILVFNLDGFEVLTKSNQPSFKILQLNELMIYKFAVIVSIFMHGMLQECSVSHGSGSISLFEMFIDKYWGFDWFLIDSSLKSMFAVFTRLDEMLEVDWSSDFSFSSLTQKKPIMYSFGSGKSLYVRISDS